MTQEIESFDIEFNRTEANTELQPAENAENTHVEPAATTAENENTESENKEPETKEEYKERTRKQFEKLALERIHAKNEADSLRMQLEALKASQNSDLSEADQLQNLIEQEAEKRIEQRQTQEKISTVYNDGVKNIPTFQESLNNLQMIGVDDGLMNAILDSEKASTILDFLGQNAEIAEKIKGLSPVQQGRQLAMIEQAIIESEKQQVKTSKVPEPIKPLTSGGKNPKEPSPDDEDLTEWFALQRKKRK